MSWRIVSLAATLPQPWRNGGGATRELLAWPAASDWRVRMSVAEVAAAGPFSRFDGVERWFAVLEGDGVVLRIDGQSQQLTRESEAFRFDGAAAVHCELPGGATRDFNLMAVAPASARMQRLHGELAVGTDGPALLALYAHASPAHALLEGEAVSVPPFHLAWRLQDRPARGQVIAEDALWMEVAR